MFTILRASLFAPRNNERATFPARFQILILSFEICYYFYRTLSFLHILFLLVKNAAGLLKS